MASWYRKRGKEVVVFIRENNKNKQLPRAITKPLDGEPDHNINYWVKQWELKNKSGTPIALTDQKLTSLVERYLEYIKSEKKRNYNTVSEHRRHLLNNVIPFFLRQSPPLADPNSWPTVSVRMLHELREKGLTNAQIYRCNVALRLFYKWLAEERIVSSDKILLRTPDMSGYKESTPLKHFLSPQDILALASGTTDSDAAIGILLGYFFSLRSQEIFGVKVSDLRTGPIARSLECSKTMAELRLFDGLTLHVERQKNKLQALSKPKNNSKGWVCCFHREGARKLVSLLADMGPEEFVIKKAPNTFYKDWPWDFAVKDLRRASLYWLGHNVDISLVQMMKHARQKSYEALSLYLRRPEEAATIWTGLKVDDL
jgi:hypothetical protein